MFFDQKTVFFRFPARNTLEKAYEITSKTKFSTPIVQFSSHLHPALSYSLHVEAVTELRQSSDSTEASTADAAELEQYGRL